jgi:hypothetical protein
VTSGTSCYQIVVLGFMCFAVDIALLEEVATPQRPWIYFGRKMNCADCEERNLCRID